ncbi:unnamed protein product, partial [Musa hybrid cultivar]
MSPEIIPAAAEESAASTVVSALLFSPLVALVTGVKRLLFYLFLVTNCKTEINLRKRRQKRRRREEKTQRPRRGLGPEGLAIKLMKMKNKHDI